MDNNKATTTLGHVNRRSFLTMVGGVAMALPFSSAVLAAGKKGGTLNYAMSTYPPNLRPWESSGQISGGVKTLIMRGLLGFDGDGNLTAELAESWSLADDKTYAFKLRDNAVFSNGKPVTSKDVAWTIGKIIAKDSTAYFKGNLTCIKEVKVLDDKNFELKLDAPNATLLQVLANYHCPILSAESTTDNSIGSGPFVMTKSERGVFIELKRFDKYYKKDEPYLDGIRMTAYPDENLRYAALQSGDVDIIEYVPWSKFDAISKDPNLQLQTSLGPWMFLMFNCSKGPFADKRVRQAVGYAIKRQDVVDAAFAGRGEPLTHLPNPQGSTIKLDFTKAQWSYDMEKAKSLLADAGYPNGFDCTLLATSTYAMHQDTASIVQAYLQMVGINAKLNLPDWGQRIISGKNGDYDLAVHGVSGFYNDPDTLSVYLHTADHPTYSQSFGFKSETIDDLLRQGREELDLEKRTQIYQKLAEAYFDEAPQVPLNWRQQAYALRNNVSGFKNMPGFLNVLSYDTLDQTKLG